MDRKFRLAIVMLGATLVASLAATSSASAANSCVVNGTVSSNCTLDADYYGPIVITSYNVTLNCNGYSLIGDESGIGIYADWLEHITIKNCFIRDLEVGVKLWAVQNSLVQSVSSNSNSDDGFELDELYDVGFVSCTANNNLDDGIDADYSGQVDVSYSSFSGNVEDGIKYVENGAVAYIQNNSFNGNGDEAIQIEGGIYVTANYNTTWNEGSCGNAIKQTGSNHVITPNTCN